MSTGGFKRKLSAIFSADVAGYSRLMGEDEESTVKTLANYKGAMNSLIEQHRGRVVDSPGDNLLSEFASVVDAVQCAVAVQKKLKDRNSYLPKTRRMLFRIGINLGDVIEEQDRLYGEGVNIAARLESLADPGGICISKTAFDHTESKLPFGYRYIGEQTVKNIAKPIGAYKVLMDPRVIYGEEKNEGKAGLPGKPPSPLPAKPSIAVLPFVNMSKDPDQEYFTDGITEDIITDLSKVSGILVIARNSSFIYKGKPVKIQQIAEELGVSYVLEGSIRRAGGRLRINVQLIDAKTRNHLWADRYDRELKDIFSVQDEITQKVVSELAVTMTTDEFERLTRKHTENFEAYDLWLRAWREFSGLKKDNLLKGQALVKKTVELDPNFAGGYVGLSFALTKSIRFGFSSSPLEDADEAFVLAQKAVSVDETYAMSYFVLADACLNKGQHDDAVDAAMAYVRIQPGDAFGQMILGFFLHWAGRGEEAVKALNKVKQLDPKYLYSAYVAYLDFEGFAYFTAGHYEESIEAWNKAIDRFGPLVQRQAFLIASYSELGRNEEARKVAQQLLNTNPNFSLTSWEYAHMYKHAEDAERLLNALRKAGLK